MKSKVSKSSVVLYSLGSGIGGAVAGDITIVTLVVPPSGFGLTGGIQALL
jgi:hypothetical protein